MEMTRLQGSSLCSGSSIYISWHELQLNTINIQNYNFTVFIVLLQIHPLAKKDFKDFPFRLKIVLLKVDKHYQY